MYIYKVESNNKRNELNCFGWVFLTVNFKIVLLGCNNRY